MKPRGLHLLLTYQCTYECDHCFVWGSSRQSGTLTISQISDILSQARALPECNSVYFEGGEPFLYYAVLQRGVAMAKEMGFDVGIVTNAYWATSEEDALEWLKPFEGTLSDLSVSCDAYHADEEKMKQARMAADAAKKLGIPVGTISIAQPDNALDAGVIGHLPEGESKVMYRGRAARKLTDPRSERPWLEFTECPHEELVAPDRLHLDPLGNLHICQGITLGNLFERPLEEICRSYDPEAHPIVGPLLKGGPAELARIPGVSIHKGYADACHLCYETRDQLRRDYPEVLGPGQMYGDMEH